MIDFRILLPYYIDLNDDTLNSIDKITKDFSISTDNLSIFTFSDLGVFCNFLPTSQSAHTREKLIFINGIFQIKIKKNTQHPSILFDKKCKIVLSSHGVMRRRQHDG